MPLQEADQYRSVYITIVYDRYDNINNMIAALADLPIHLIFIMRSFISMIGCKSVSSHNHKVRLSMPY